MKTEVTVLGNLVYCICITGILKYIELKYNNNITYHKVELQTVYRYLTSNHNIIAILNIYYITCSASVSECIPIWFLANHI